MKNKVNPPKQMFILLFFYFTVNRKTNGHVKCLQNLNAFETYQNFKTFTIKVI